jgi:hypothetical protein
LNSLSIFWNLVEYDFSSPEKTFFGNFDINRIINFTDYKKNKSKNDFQNIVFFDREELKNIKKNIINIGHITEKLVPYEENIYRVLKRNLANSGLRITKQRLHLMYLNILASIDEISRNNNVTLSLFFDTPHHPVDYISFLYFKSQNIVTIVTKFLPSTHSGKFRHRRYITTDFPFLDSSYISYYNSALTKLSEANLPKDLNDYIIEYNSADNVEYNALHLGSRWDFKYVLIKVIKAIVKYSLELRFSLIFSKTLVYLQKFLIDEPTRYLLLTYYESLTSSPSKEKYVYFPFQYQPEATTSPLGNEFENFNLVIERVLRELPNNYNLYVREHPSYWHRLSSTDKISDYRSFDFYKKLTKNTRIKLISHKENHQALIRNSQFVVTVTGTVAFEAFGMNKKVLMFGDYIYALMPNTIRINKMDGSFNIIELLKEKNLSTEFIATLEALSKVSYTISQEKSSKSILALDLINEFKFIIKYLEHVYDNS